MKVTVDARAPSAAVVDLLAVPIASDEVRRSRLAPRLAAIDRSLGGAIAAAVQSGDFKGKTGQQVLAYPDRRRKAKRVLLWGMGEAKAIDAEALRAASGAAVGRAAAARSARVALVAPPLGAGADPESCQALAEGAVLGGYRFDAYREKSDETASRISSLTLLVPREQNLRASRDAARRGVVIAESQNVARELSNLPPNVLSPEQLAQEARSVAREVGLAVRVLDVPELEKRKMGAILAVGGGSSRPPRLVALEYAPKGVAKKSPPFCIVGKGITFDSGGISIKPAQGMDEMKHDMSGAATVIGVLRGAALLALPVRVVGVIGAAENLPGGKAYRPGDIVTSGSGKTIEVLNTDAEGRVVLADALHYAKTEYDPAAIVDLATLTGACVVALGRWATGLFGSHAGLVEAIRAAGEKTGELAWPMPLLDGHKREIKSEVADIKNSGGRQAGASTAAAFLSHFVGDTPWVHLDIAGTAWTTSAANGYQPRGATGVGVRLLLEVLRHWDGSALAAAAPRS
ncbi:MAG: leucyl aminopeptidase [Deltaproteobacteria bacterium]|nr:MAG: leucyl aminopeptidase [Deltaproteobacteria bacterium]